MSIKNLIVQEKNNRRVGGASLEPDQKNTCASHTDRDALASISLAFHLRSSLLTPAGTGLRMLFASHLNFRGLPFRAD